MIVRILGYRTRVCDSQCRDAFKCDREHGLNYGLHVLNGVPCMHREQWSLVALRCAYCGNEVNGRIPESLKKKFGINAEANN